VLVGGNHNTSSTSQEVLVSALQTQIEALSAQIKEKDEQINKLLSIVERLSDK
jgi:hypothetical protein